MKKVLLICLDNLDSLVFSSALAAALASDPDIHLGLLCKDYTSKLAYLMPGVKQVFAADPFWKRSPYRKKGKLGNFLKCLTTVREHRFDEAIIVSDSWHEALAARFAGIPKVYALRGRVNRLLASQTFLSQGLDKPAAQSLLKSFASLLQKIPADSQTHLLSEAIPAYERPRALADKKLVVLHAFCGTEARCAPLAVWVELARALRQENFHVLWTGIPLETQRIRKAYPDEWGPANFVDTWAQDLLQLAWIWSEAALFVGHDSGPLHVAHALGVPVLGLYLPGEPERSFPQGSAPSLVLHRSSPADIQKDVLIQTSLSLLGKALS